ncbi:MAG: PD-(D/E)XK nuclease family protein [Deltaproteobacteria bacterium]|jgi:CRISPR/Cas system-associated exonuclease Cas4 (RecB family)|nr:PD-(D/E)XK nuclease family protein [Deltaproteobacteria bacterium]
MADIINFPVEEKIHISASAVNKLHGCMRDYYYKYVAGIPRESTPDAMLLGIALHRALSYFYLVLKQDKEECSLEVLQEVVNGKIEDEELQKEATRLLELFLKDGFKPDPEQIVAVEQKFELPLHDPETGELLSTVVGYWDLITRNKDESLTITDHKIVKRNNKAKAEAPDLQMALYSWATKNNFGAEKVNLQYQDIIRNKTAKHDIKQITRQDPQKEEADALTQLRSANNLISVLVAQDNVKELMFPNKSWRCKNCTYREICQSE